MIDWFSGSYLGIVVLLMLTGAGLPIPEEVIIIGAGVFSSHGTLEPWPAFAACLFGALAGDAVMYWIGFHFGRNFIRKHRYWARLVHAEREAQIEKTLHQHGLKMLFLSRFLVGLRSPVYLAAGILHFPFRRFFLFDLLCATMVVGTFFWLAYWLGQDITSKLVKHVEITVTVLVVLSAIGAGIYFWRRHKRKLAAGPAESSEDADPASETPDESGDVEQVA